MEIRIAKTDDDIAACFPVMHELRPHIPADAFVARVRLQEQTGYLLAGLWKNGEVVAVAGFRILENLAWGRFLYVDDLVTLASRRSCGHGRALLAWLAAYAQAQGCGQLHLDSGVQRRDAHRFYQREGMAFSCHHYQLTLPPRSGGPAPLPCTNL